MEVGHLKVIFIFLSMQGAIALQSCYNTETKPWFSEGVTDVSVVSGRDVTFTCVVESLGEKYTVAWKHMGRNGILTFKNRTLTRDPRFSITVHNNRIFSLHIQNVQVADSGRYVCQVNTEPMKNNVGFLQVVVFPDLQVPIRRVEAVIGANATLGCNLKSNPKSETYWKRDRGGFTIVSNNKYGSIILDTGYKVQMRLTIKNLNPDDFGTYTCVAKNSVGEAKGKVTLYETEPWFAEAVPNVTVVAGSDVTLPCVVEDLGGKYAVVWLQLDQHTILTYKNLTITGNPRFSLIVRDNRIFSLHVQNVQVADSGRYLCQMKTNPMKDNVGFLKVVESSEPHAAAFTSSEVSTAKISPKIWIPNCWVGADIGTDVTMRCNLKSNPKSLTYWKRNGEGLIFYPNIKYKSILIDRGDNKVQMRLIIKIVGSDDFGLYSCVAKNSLGEAEGNIMLHKISEPHSSICPSSEGSKSSTAESPPKIRIPNRLVGASILDDVTLVCNVKSNPEPIVTWTVGGNEILMNNTKYSTSVIDNGVNKVQMRLTIKNLKPDDFGSYKCIAWNSLGDAEGKITLFEIFRYFSRHSSREELRKTYIFK